MLKKSIFSLACVSFFFISGFSSRPQNDITMLKPIENKAPDVKISNNLDAACVVAQRISDPVLRKRALISVAKGYAAMGNTDTAYNIANMLSGSTAGSARLMIITDIALSLAEQKRNDDALQFLAKLNNNTERDFAYEHLCLYFFGVDDLTTAKTISTLIKSPIVASRIQRKYIEYLVQNNDIEEALNMTKSIQSINEKELALSSVSPLLAAQKNYDALDSCLDQIQQNNAKNQALKSICDTFSSQGDFKRALTYLELITDDAFIYAQTQGLITKHYAERQKFESAYQLSDSITIPQLHNQALSDIAVELSKANQLNNALDLTDTIESDVVQQETYLQIAETLARNSKFEDALSVTTKLTDKSKADTLIIRAASYFGERKDYLHPTLLINQISDPILKSKAIAAFLLTFAPYGSIDKIKDILNSIPDATIKDDTLSKLSVVLVSNNRPSESLECIKLISKFNLQAFAALQSAQTLSTISTPESTYPFLDLSIPIVEKVLSGTEKVDALLLGADIYTNIHLNKSALNLLSFATKEIRSLPATSDKATYFQSTFKLYVELGDYETALELMDNFSKPEDRVALYLMIPSTTNPDVQKKLTKYLQKSL